jgi:two-component system cell cycle response regulator DivK
MKPLILIVEDNERNRKLVRTILEFSGFEVVECGDGEPAIEIARARAPALILMDIELPKLDGVSAFKRLRSDPATASIPVVAVTASVTSSQRERIVATGFDGYIAKPIDVEEFGRAIERLVRKKAGTSA